MLRDYNDVGRYFRKHSVGNSEPPVYRDGVFRFPRPYLYRVLMTIFFNNVVRSISKSEHVIFLHQSRQWWR